MPTEAEPMTDWLQQAMLRRYLDGALDADETARFEAFLLDRPELLDHLEGELALRDALAEHDWAPQSAAIEGAAAAVNVPERRRSTPAWLSAAAGLVAGVVLAVGWLRLDTSSVEVAATQPPRLIFEAWRGAGLQVREEPGDPDSSLVLVEIGLVEGRAPHSVQARFSDRDPIDLASSHLTSDGFLAYLVPSDWLGRSQLHLRLDDTSGEADLIIDLDRPSRE